jgi:hypothetical protein
MDRERVDATIELGRKGRVDHAMALDPALPPERLRYDIQAEMALPARPVPGMAFVLVGFIDHSDAFRSESFGQLPCDQVGAPHGLDLRSRIWPVNARVCGRPRQN